MSENRLVVDAVEDSLDGVQDFIEEKLEAYGCEKKVMLQIRLAVEKIFVNIFSYAYGDETGKAEVLCEIGEEPLSVTIQFLDSGKPFDPLEKEDVDTTGVHFMEAEGGFGIHLVKKTMDAVDYKYEDGKNILTIKKKL
ncbi:MAG: ATP-binding protein [Lachnospiraceae bacterium]|nr:ATP-binding protein [Lachnospiraceae bacterium]